MIGTPTTIFAALPILRLMILLKAVHSHNIKTYIDKTAITHDDQY